MVSNFAFHARHTVADNEYYRVVLDELRRPSTQPSGFDQLLVAHIVFHNFSKQALQRLLDEWAVFRSVIAAPLFAYCQDGDENPEKWARFMRLLDFKEVPDATLPASDGSSRRVFVSHKDSHAREANSDDLQHHESLGATDSISDPGIPECAGDLRPRRK